MSLNRSTTIRLIKYLLAFFIILVITLYAIWRSLNYARGPVIEIFQPNNGSSIDSKTVNITGRVIRVNSISLNGHAITVDTEGNFNEPLVIFHGLNIITLVAKDQFDRSVKKELQLVGLQN